MRLQLDCMQAPLRAEVLRHSADGAQQVRRAGAQGLRMRNACSLLFSTRPLVYCGNAWMLQCYSCSPVTEAGTEASVPPRLQG